MKAYEIQGGFGLDNLRPADRPAPVAGPGQVLIRVRAVSLNFRDLLTVTGHYNPRQPLPLVPCSDGAGEDCAGPVPGCNGDEKDSRYEQKVGAKQQYGADETGFLCPDGEDEVGVLCRQKTKLGLGAGMEALSGQSA